MKKRRTTEVLLVLVFTCSPLFGAETEGLFSGDDCAVWSTARSQARLNREFSLCRVTPATNPPAVRWRFVSKGVRFNDLFLQLPIQREFTAIRVRLKNEGAAVALAAKTRDANGAEWTTPSQPLPGRSDWRWVSFPRTDWQVAPWSRDPDHHLDFPLRYFTLIAFELTPGVLYDLRLERVEVKRPDRPVATVRSFSLPSRLRAGRTVTARLRFSLDKPCREPTAALEFRRQGAVSFQVPLPLPTPLAQVRPGREVTLPGAPIPVPRYAFGGRHSVTLRLGEAHIDYRGKRADEELTTVTITARKPATTRAEVKLHNGTPTLFIDGTPHCGMVWATYHPTPEVFHDFAAAGVDLFTFSGTPTEAGYGLAKTTWIAPDRFDDSQFDRRVMMLLQADPDAYFFPRLYLHAPKWWSDRHPEDVVLMDPGDGKPVPFIHAGGKPAPSWASAAWRRDTVEALRRFIAHVHDSPYADRIIGYHLSSGTTEEWMMWGGNENQWVDYSPVNLARFRKWLKAKYGTEDRLRVAWNDPAATFAAATIPAKAQRQHTDLGALRDPATEQPVLDYYLYNSDLVADTICMFAHAVKEMTNHRKILGVFYGYLLQLCGEQRQQNAGHLALEKVLACPDIDFLCSPTSYAFRQLGGRGTSHFMSLFGSVKLHGKLWFDENDIRTSLSGGRPGEWGRPRDVAGDLLQQDKELANCLVNGAAQWWFDVGGNKYDAPRLMARIGALVGDAHKVLDLDRAPVDEVALVVDERSLCYLRVGDPLGRWLLLDQIPSLARIGAPVGHYLVTDLPRLKRQKLFLVATSFAPTEADRRAVDALKRDGHVLVFLWAAGLYRNGRIDEAAMSDFTGIRLRLARDPASLHVTLAPGHALTAGLGGKTYGVRHKTAPVVYADDPTAEVLGTLDGGRPGLVVKTLDTWTAVYSAAPLLPASLLRRFAERAGVHLYLDTDDVLWATKELLGVCAAKGGPRRISLPQPATVMDLDTGVVLARKAGTFSADFTENATRVFVVRNPAEEPLALGPGYRGGRFQVASGSSRMGAK